MNGHDLNAYEAAYGPSEQEWQERLDEAALEMDTAWRWQFEGRAFDSDGDEVEASDYDEPIDPAGPMYGDWGPR
jgi:hypothetical protein